MASIICISLSPFRILKQVSNVRNFVVHGRGFVAASPVTKSSKRTFRSNNVAKLIELNKKYQLFEPGQKVLDIGAAPGSWSQYLSTQTNSDGKDEKAPVGSVIAIDINSFESIEGVHVLPNMDFLMESSQIKIMEVLGEGEKFDIILSDMSPPLLGLENADKLRTLKTFFCVYLFIVKNLRHGGTCLVNVRGVEDEKGVRDAAEKFFEVVSFPLIFKSKKVEPDVYLLGRHFLGTHRSQRSYDF